jgi:hypothetical protein
MYKNVQSDHTICVITSIYYKVTIRSHFNCLSSLYAIDSVRVELFPVSQEIDEVIVSGLQSFDLSLVAEIPELLPFSEVIISLKRFKS